MATGKAIDVDRRSLPLLLGCCFFPKRDATPWGINSAGPGRVESGLAHEDQDACCASFACAAGSPIQAASKLLTQPREVRRHGRLLRCTRRQISRLSAVEPAGGLNEPEPGWLAST